MVKDLVFDIIGNDKASRTFDRVGHAIDGNTSKLDKLHKAGGIAGKALLLGFAAVGAGAIAATKAAAEDEAGQAQLAKQLKNTTGATDDQVSSIETWITAQGKALGVADDELRPALAKLATATGDVAQAQKLAALAMDISAGSGKSLDQVSTALAKAQNGSVAGLSKLNLATKTNAKDTAALEAAQIAVKGAQQAYTKAVADHGPKSAAASLASDKLHLAQTKLTDAQTKTKTTTMSAADAMDALAKKYGGAASSAADTAAGKQKILTVQLSELKEQIGTGLLPVMTALAGQGLKMVDWVSHNTTTVAALVGTVGGLLAITWGVSKAIEAWTAITKIATAVQIVWTNAQWALNIAMNANPIGIVVLAIAALVAGVIIAYKHSETFRNVVDKTFSFIGKVVPQVIGAVVGFVKDHWGLLVSIIGGPMGIIVVQIIKHWDTVKAATLAVASFVVDKAKDFGKFANLVVGHVDDVVDFFRKLPGKVTGFLSDLPGQLKTIGGQIIGGLKQGIEDAAHLVWDAVQKIIDKIPKKIRQIMGISSPSKVTTELGEFIGQGLADGMSAKQGAVGDAAQKLADKAKAKLDRLKDAFASVRDSVAGAFTGDLFSASSASELVTSLSGKSGMLAQLLPAMKKLQGWGWKPGILAQLFQSGNGALIIDLAANQAEATQAAGLLGSIGNLSDQIGKAVAQDEYGDQIAAASGHDGGGKGGKDGKGEHRREDINVNLKIDLDSKQIHRALLKLKRDNGGAELGLA